MKENKKIFLHPVYDFSLKKLGQLNLRSIFLMMLFSFPLFSLIKHPEPFYYGRSLVLGLFFLLIGLYTLFSSIRNETNLLISRQTPLLIHIFALLYLCGVHLISGAYLQSIFAINGLLLSFFILSSTERKEFTWAKVLDLVPGYLLFIFGVNRLIIKLSGRVLYEGVGIFGHPHFEGAFYLLFLGPLFYLLERQKEELSRRTKLLILCDLLCIAYYNVALSHSKMIATLTGLSFVFFLVFQLSAYRSQGKSFPKRMLCFLLIGLFFIGGGTYYSSSKKVSLSFKERSFAWRLCLRNWKNWSFLGKGGGAFERWYRHQLNSELLDNPGSYSQGVVDDLEWAHNEVIHIIIEFGYPGLLFFCLISYYFFERVYFFFLRRNLHFLLSIGLINLWCFSWVSFPFRMPSSSLWGLFLIILFFLEPISNKEVVHLRIPSLKRRSIVLHELHILLWLILIVYGLKFSMAMHYFRVGMERGKKFTSKQQNLHKAQAYIGDNELVYFSLGKMYLDQGDGYRSAYYFKKAFYCNPTPYALWGIAVSYDILGDYELAMDHYERLKLLAPNFRPPAHNLKVLAKRKSLSKK